MKNYYISSQGKRLGPIDEESMRSAYFNGDHGEETYVWTPGMETWKTLREVFGPISPIADAPDMPPMPPMPSAPPMPPPPAASDISIPAPPPAPAAPCCPPPPVPKAEKQYYTCMPDGTRNGPISERVLKSGAYAPEILVWTEGMADWQPLRIVIGYGSPRGFKPFFLKRMSFSGRATRKEFWLTFLGTFIVFIILRLIGMRLINLGLNVNEYGQVYIWDDADYYSGLVIILLSIVFFIGFLLPSTVRRLHDAEIHAGFAVLILGSITAFGNFGDALSVIGGLCFLGWIVLMCFDSKRGTNKFGSSEKYPQ